MTDEEIAPRGRFGSTRRYWPAVVAIAAYCVVSALAYWPIAPLSERQLPGCGCGDVVQEVWFLSWTAHALTHGANPFFSSFINYPYGVNLLVNTSMPLLGALATLITVHLGPVAAFNFLLRLSFVASATSMLFVARQFCRGWIGPSLAGLIYGFSPYMISQGNGHLFLTFVPLPPLILLALYRLCVCRKEDKRSWGITLGLLAAAQFYISMEVLTATAICALAVLVLVLLRRHDDVVRRLRAVAPGLFWSTVAFSAGVAYALWFFFFGPQHVHGPSQSLANTGNYRSDLLGPIVPTVEQLLAPRSIAAFGSQFVGGDIAENGSYIGIPLLCLLVFCLVWLRKERLVQLLAVFGGTAFVLSLGTRLDVANHDTGIPLPFLLLRHVFVFGDLIAARFDLYVDLAVSLLVGFALDTALHHSAGPAERHVMYRKASIAFGAVVTVLPLVPHLPYETTDVTVPSYVTSVLPKRIPRRSLLFIYPYDVTPNNQAMLWQALDSFDFRIMGGEASTPASNGAATSLPPLLDPVEIRVLFLSAMVGSTRRLPTSSLNVRNLSLLREFLVRWNVPTIAVDHVGSDPSHVVRALTKTLGTGPLVEGGVDVWYKVQADLAVHSGSHRGSGGP